MAEKTITVAKAWGDGDMEINREDFINRWTSHVGSIKILSCAHFTELCKITERVGEIAAEEFDLIYDETRDGPTPS